MSLLSLSEFLLLIGFSKIPNWASFDGLEEPFTVFGTFIFKLDSRCMLYSGTTKRLPKLRLVGLDEALRPPFGML